MSAYVHIEQLNAEGTILGEVGLVASVDVEWIIDSRATRHMTSRKQDLHDFRPLNGEIFMGDNSTIPIRGSGILSLIPDGSGGFLDLEVLYVPGLSYNLLSVHELCLLGLILDFDDSSFRIRRKDSTDALVIGLVQNGLYKFKCPSLSSSLVTLSDYDLWHARFGHINNEYLRRASSMVNGLPPVGGSKNLCHSCLQGKQHREPFPKQHLVMVLLHFS